MDQGLHPRARRASRTAAARRVAAPAAAPTGSTCGRCTSACTTTIERYYAPGGLFEAFAEAKRAGKVRFVGIAGHKQPGPAAGDVEGGFPFDTVMMPLNVLDASFNSFEHEGAAAGARARYRADRHEGVLRRPPADAAGVDPEDALRYAMSLPGVLTTVTGIDSQAVLDHHLRIANDFVPLDAAALDALRLKYHPAALGGHYELYKVDASHDSDVGLIQHGLPTTLYPE